MRRILVALFGLLICGSAFACTVYEHEVVSVDLDKGIAEVREVPKYIGPGSCGGPSGEQLEERRIRNEIDRIERWEKAGHNMTDDKARLLNSLK